MAVGPQRGWCFWLSPEMIDSSHQQWKDLGDVSNGVFVYCKDISADAEMNELLSMKATSFPGAALALSVIRSKLSVHKIGLATEAGEPTGDGVLVAKERDIWWSALGSCGRETVGEVWNQVMKVSEEAKAKSRASFRVTMG